MRITTTARTLGCIFCALVTPHAWAIPMGPGMVALAAPEPDPVGGVVVAGPLVTPMVGGAFTATLTSTVIQGDVSNPLGGLTFVYQVFNSPNSFDAIGRVTVTGYSGWLTDMSYQTPGPVGLPPTLMDRSFTGDAVGFSFIGPPLGLGVLLPGATSAMLVVQTNAPAFAPSMANVIDGALARGPSLAPVPEPASMMFLAAGLLVGVRVRCRR
jgi:hypothetical protein